MYQRKSLKRNFAARTIISLVEMLSSLIVFPYVARILGPEIIGEIDFVTTTVTYIVTAGAFGVAEYGAREVARNKENLSRLSPILTRLLSLRLLLALILSVFYLIFIIPYFGESTLLFYVSLLIVISSAFNVVWALEALEDFSYLAVVRTFTKVLLLVFLLLQVKGPEDAILYFIALITADFLYFFSAFIRLRKFIGFRLPFFKLISFAKKADFKNLSQLFLLTLLQSSIAATPVLMMGNLKLFHELGFFTAAQRFYMLGFYLTIPLSTVLLSRSMSFTTETHFHERDKHLDDSANAIITLGLPISLGIFSISDELIYLFVGNQYAQSALILKILSLLILVYSVNNFWGMQVIFSRKGDKALLTSNSIGLLFILIFSYFAILYYQHIGAAASLLATNCLILSINYYNGRKLYQMTALWRDILKSSFAAGAMLFVISPIEGGELKVFVMKILAGAITYMVLLFLTRHSFTRNVFK